MKTTPQSKILGKDSAGAAKGKLVQQKQPGSAAISANHSRSSDTIQVVQGICGSLTSRELLKNNSPIIKRGVESISGANFQASAGANKQSLTGFVAESVDVSSFKKIGAATAYKQQTDQRKRSFAITGFTNTAVASSRMRSGASSSQAEKKALNQNSNKNATRISV